MLCMHVYAYRGRGGEGGGGVARGGGVNTGQNTNLLPLGYAKISYIKKQK